MPRIRTLKPEALQHRKVGRLSDRAFRLWVGLITQADDEGRVNFDADQFRVLIWGYHRSIGPDTVGEAMDELRAVGLCRLYGDSQKLYVDLPSWPDHQMISHPTKSKLPSFKTTMAVSGQTPTWAAGVSFQKHPEDSGNFQRTPWGSEGSEGSEGRIGSEAPEPSGDPASAPGGAPALQEAGPANGNSTDPAHIGGTVTEFMASLRRAAGAPVKAPNAHV